MNTLDLLQRASHSLARLGEILSGDEANLPDKAEALVEEVRQLRRQLEETRLKELAHNAESVFEQKEIGGVLLQTGKFPEAAPDLLRDVGDRAKSRHSPTVVVMASVTGGDCRLVVMADDAAVKKGADAGALVKEAAALLGGRGGGRPNMAQGGGKSIDNLDRAVAKIAVMLESQVNVHAS
jgi:alanyl-tRNA synthetase